MKKTVSIFKELHGEWHNRGDLFGGAMGAGFDIGGELQRRGLDYSFMDFHPSPYATEPDISEYNYEYLASLTDAELVSVGKLAIRVIEICESKGLGY